MRGKGRVSWHNHVESGAGASIVLEEDDRAEQIDV